jgi:hypothetical protein
VRPAVELLTDFGNSPGQCNAGLDDLFFFSTVHASEVHDDVSFLNRITQIVIVIELLPIARNDVDSFTARE